MFFYGQNRTTIILRSYISSNDNRNSNCLRVLNNPPKHGCNVQPRCYFKCYLGGELCCVIKTNLAIFYEKIFKFGNGRICPEKSIICSRGTIPCIFIIIIFIPRYFSSKFIVFHIGFFHGGFFPSF